MNDYIYVMDTETSGFDKKFNDIIEIAAVKLAVNPNGTLQYIDGLDIYINPGYKLTQRILDFNAEHHTGIDDAFLAKNGKTENYAAIQTANFLGKNPVVIGHNFIQFDLKFIDKMFVKGIRRHFYAKNLMTPHGYPQNSISNVEPVMQFNPHDFACAEVLDTCSLIKKYVKMDKYTLPFLYSTLTPEEQYISRGNPRAHTAIGDCCSTADVLAKFWKECHPKELEHLFCREYKAHTVKR